MKLIKRIVSIILISVLLVINITPASAFNRNEHDRYMSDVLFKDFKNIENDVNIKDDIKALEAASYLTIDQYNGNGNNALLMLNEYGVKSLPSSINEIDYSAGAYHRRATHRGWDAESTGVYNTSDRNRWIIRKKILLNTADKMFNFNGNNSKKDSFCALIYYTHILGDRIADTKYYPNADIIELGGRMDKQDISHELVHHIEILFSDQKDTHKYNHVVSKLDSYNSKLSELLKNNNGILSDDNFKLYHEYAEAIMDVLRWNVPEMLKEEDFFREKFY